MATLRFTTTRLSGLRSAGRLGEMQHAVIAAFLQRELGDRYGRLFADFEPEGSDRRAWYAECAALPRRVADLPPADGAAMRSAVSAMIDAIRALAERIGRESAQKSNLARILTAATTFPEEDLWCDGDQPIIVNWGFTAEDRPDSTPRAITGLAARSQLVRDAERTARLGSAASTAIESSPVGFWFRARRGHAGWITALLWLFFVVLLAAVYRTLLPACGIDGSWRLLGNWSALQACDRSSAVDEAAEEGARLQALVRQAELQVAEQHQICAAPPAQIHADRQVEERLPAAAPRGEVEVSLIWDNHADLDLIIDCPGGEKLSQASYGLQACGGRLLADVNKEGAPLIDHPIEHAAWHQPPPGTYAIQVELYGYNDVSEGTDIPFTIHIRQGANDKVIPGHIRGSRMAVTAATVTF